MLPNVVALPWPVRDWAGKLNAAHSSAYRKLQVAGGETHEASKNAGVFVAQRRREIAQLWWQANEKAILAGKWQDVRPGEDYDTPEFRAFLAQLSSQKLSMAQTVPAPVTPIVQSGTPPGVAFERPRQPSNRTPYIIGAFFLLAGAVALLWRTVRKRQATKRNGGKVED